MPPLPHVPHAADTPLPPDRRAVLRWAGAAAVGGLALAAGATPASASTTSLAPALAPSASGAGYGPADGVRLKVLHAFDPTRGEISESVAVGPDGTLFVTVLHLGRPDELWLRRPGREGRFLPVPEGTRPYALLPLADGSVLIGVYSADDDLAGVWRLDRRNRYRRVIALPGGAQANGFERARNGDLFITDGYEGRLFRVPAGSTTAEVWYEGPELLRDPNVLQGIPGTNTARLHRGYLWVSNSSQRTLLRLPVDRRNRRLGPPELVPAGNGVLIDEMLFTGRADEAYIVTAFGGNSLERFDARTGKRVVLADGDDGLDSPTCIVWAPRSRGGALVLANAGFPFTNPSPQPTIMRVTLR